MARDMREWMVTVERQLREARRSGVPIAIKYAQDALKEANEQLNQYKGLTPTRPIELTYQTALYMDREGVIRGRVTIDFPDVVFATDGTPITVTRYELQGRAEGYGNVHSAYPGHLMPGQSYPGTPGSVIFSQAQLKPMQTVATSGTSTFTVEGITQGQTLRYRVRAVGGTFTNDGLWSQELVIYVEKDTTEPPQPTPPRVRISRGVIMVDYDGQAVNGPMPADLDYVALAHGTQTSPEGEVYQFDRSGGTYVLPGANYYDVQFFRLRAVDQSGNWGPWSAQATGVATPLVDSDVILSHIDASKTIIDNAGALILESGETLDNELEQAKADREAANKALAETQEKLNFTFPSTVNVQFEEAKAAAAADAAAKAEAARIAAEQAAAIDAAAKAEQAEANAAIDASNKANQALADAQQDATNKANAAETAAINAAALDATAKAEQAEADAAVTAQQKADAALAAAKTDAQQKADAARQAAIDAAALDATAKAEQAEADAAAAAATDATNKANAAKQEAIDAAALHANQVASGAEQSAIDAAAADAQAKADAAKQAAIDAAALDATAKMEQAEADAALDASNKANAALDAAKADATSKANAAEQAAIDAAALDAQAKAEQAEANAALDAANKANQALADAKADATVKADEAERLAKEAAALDATAKAEAAEAAAITAAATDATAKANQAKADAQAAAEEYARQQDEPIRLAAEAAQGDADTANAAAQAAQATADQAEADALAAAGLAESKGRVWWETAAPPAGTTHKWVGSANASVSTESFNGVVQRRNQILNPRPINTANWSSQTPGSTGSHDSTIGPSGFGAHVRTLTASGIFRLNASKAGDAVAAGDVLHISAWFYSSRAMGLSMEIGWTGDVTSYVKYPFKSGPNVVVGWQFLEVDITVPAGKTGASIAQFISDATPQTGDVFKASAFLLENNTTGKYFDGGTPDDREFDLWVDTDAGNTPHRWNPSTDTWVASTDQKAIDAANAAAAAQSTANTAVTNAQTAQDRADDAHSLAGTAQSNAEDAMAAAGTKTTTLYSPNLPSGVGQTNGDTWRQTSDTGDVIAEWRWSTTANGWVSQKVSSDAISNLDVGKLTVGTGVISQLVAEHIAAESGQFISLAVSQLTAGTGAMAVGVIDKIFSEVVQAKMVTSDEFIGENAILTGAITAPKITASEELTAKVAQFLYVKADQIDVNDLFADATYTGSLDAHVGTFLTHSDGSGYITTVTGQGIKVTYTDGGTGEVSDRLKLGTFDEEYLGFTDDTGESSVSIDKYGGGAFRDLSARDSFTYQGTELSDVLANIGRTVAWQSRLSNSTSFDNTRHWPFVRLTFTAEPMRMYRIHTTPMRATSNSTQSNVKVYLKYAINSAATTSSPHLNWSYMSAVNNVTTTFMMQGFNRMIAIGPHNASDAGEWSILVALTTETSGSSATIRTGTDNPFVLWVEDIGPWIEQNGEIIDGVSTASNDSTVVSSSKNYDKTYSWNGVRSYTGSNATYAWNTSKGYQGMSPAGYGNLKSLWTFPSVTADLSGAAVSEIWAYFYFEHWYNNAGGTARIVLHGHSTVPSSYSSSILAITVSGWKRGTGRWVKLPSSVYNGFKTGAYRGLGLEGNGTYETYGIANASRLRIKYSK